jgi:hypothetical protein
VAQDRANAARKPCCSSTGCLLTSIGESRPIPRLEGLARCRKADTGSSRLGIGSPVGESRPIPQRLGIGSPVARCRDSCCARTTGSESVFARERVPPTHYRRDEHATLRHPEVFGPGP